MLAHESHTHEKKGESCKDISFLDGFQDGLEDIGDPHGHSLCLRRHFSECRSDSLGNVGEIVTDLVSDSLELIQREIFEIVLQCQLLVIHMSSFS